MCIRDRYITGSQSGAYGVVEGDTNGFLSTGKSLVVRTLSGRFVPGETLVSEEGGLLRIARENTLSHIIVNATGSGYGTDDKVSINGITYESTDVSTGVVGSALYKIEINDRDAVSVEYSTPPTVSVSGGTGATITPVLFRNTVTTFGSQSVKSLYSTFGDGNKFSADIETIDAIIQKQKQ